MEVHVFQHWNEDLWKYMYYNFGMEICGSTCILALEWTLMVLATFFFVRSLQITVNAVINLYLFGCYRQHDNISYRTH